MNVTTVEVNVTTKDRHYLVVKVNYSDVHYHIVVKVNTVEPPRKGHFGTNINSSGLSPL